MSTFCSWCLQPVVAKVVDKTIFSRDLLECPHCGRTVVECRACKNLACWGSYEIEKENGIKEYVTIHNEFCGEHSGVVANFETLEASLDDLSEYEKIYKPTKINMKKIVTIGTAMIAGIILVGPLMFFGGPALGGAIGTFMGLSGAAATSAGLALIGGGSLAAGGLGMAGGLAIITVVGGCLGGACGAFVGTRYFNDVDGLSIKKICGGKGPAVITINGFLTEGKEGLSDWIEIVGNRYHGHPWYHIYWESQKLANLGRSINISTGKVVLEKILLDASLKASKMASKKLVPITNIPAVVSLAANDWHVAMVKAEKTGAILADILCRCKGEFILMGHSLGCRTIYSALQALATTDRKVHSIHLLGGAVDNEPSQWKHASNAVSNSIFNYYSKNDDVLNYMYKIGTFFSSTPIGSNPINNVNNIINIDVSKHVSGHFMYKSNFLKFHIAPHVKYSSFAGKIKEFIGLFK